MLEHKDLDVMDIEDVREELDREMNATEAMLKSAKHGLQEQYEKAKKTFDMEMKGLETRRKIVSEIFNDMKRKLQQSRDLTLDMIQKKIADLENNAAAFQNMKEAKRPISKCSEFSTMCQSDLLSVRQEMDKLKYTGYVKGSNISEELVTGLCGSVVERSLPVYLQRSRNQTLRQVHYVNVKPGQRQWNQKAISEIFFFLFVSSGVKITYQILLTSLIRLVYRSKMSWYTI